MEKTEIIILRVSSKDKETIKEKAKSKNMSMSAYIIKKAKR